MLPAFYQLCPHPRETPGSAPFFPLHLALVSSVPMSALVAFTALSIILLHFDKVAGNREREQNVGNEDPRSRGGSSVKVNGSLRFLRRSGAPLH